jgi:hypothetical protein
VPKEGSGISSQSVDYGNEPEVYCVLVQREMESGLSLLSEYIAILKAKVWMTPPNVVAGQTLAVEAATGFNKKSGWLVRPDSCPLIPQNGTG